MKNVDDLLRENAERTAPRKIYMIGESIQKVTEKTDMVTMLDQAQDDLKFSVSLALEERRDLVALLAKAIGLK